MNEVQPFTFPTTGQTVRTVTLDGEAWFIAADVTAILGYANGRDAVARHVDDEDRREFRRSEAVGIHYPFDDLRIQSVSLINESGLYSLILRSDVLGAREFKRWVTSEVLPAIRRTGSYTVPLLDQDPLAVIAATHRQLGEAIAIAKAERERADRAEFQALELAPAARLADELMQAEGDYSVREAAQILDRDRRISTGQRRLFAYLRSIGWLDRHNQPYQAQVSIGRLVVRARMYEHPRRDEQVATQQVRITPKGLAELHKRLGGASELPALVSEGVAA